MGLQELQKVTREVQEAVDSMLAHPAIVHRGDVEVRPFRSFAKDYLASLSERQHRFSEVDRGFGTRIKQFLAGKISGLIYRIGASAAVSPYVLNVVYVHENLADEELEWQKRSLGHEIVHNRCYQNGVFSEIAKSTTINRLGRNPVFLHLNEGLAEYVSLASLGQTEMMENYRKISTELLEKRSAEMLSKFAEKKLRTIASYFTGFRFIDSVEKALGLDHAIDLILSPFLRNINPLELTTKEIIEGGDLFWTNNIFRVSMIEIQEPERYIERVLA